MLAVLVNFYIFILLQYKVGIQLDPKSKIFLGSKRDSDLFTSVQLYFIFQLSKLTGKREPLNQKQGGAWCAWILLSFFKECEFCASRQVMHLGIKSSPFL